MDNGKNAKVKFVNKNFTFRMRCFIMNELKEVIFHIFDSNSDGISFLPSSVKEGELQINGFVYSRKYKEVKTELGNYYHILLYKANEFGEISHRDNFTAILTDPRVYVTNLIQNDFYGVVTKKTTGSKKFVNEIYKKMRTIS